MPLAAKSVVGLDWGSTSIKAVKVVFKGHDAVLEAGMEAKQDGEPWEETMGYVLRSLGIEKNSAVCAALPSNLIITGKSLLPPISLANTRKALKWELAQQVGINQQEITYDFTVLGHPARNAEREVVWAAARIALVQQLDSCLNSLSLRLLGVEVSPFPLLRLKPDREGRALLVDLGSQQHILCLVEGTTPLMFASFDIRQVNSLLASSAIAPRARGLKIEMYGGGAFDGANRQLYSQTLGGVVNDLGVPLGDGLAVGQIAPEYLSEDGIHLLPQFAMALALALRRR